MKTTSKLCATILLILIATVARGQDNSSKQTVTGQFYHLLFRLEELDAGGKVINTRAYTTAAYTGDPKTESIRSGDRIPVSTTTGQASPITYLDIGFRIDVEDVAEKDNKLQLNVTAVQSSVATATQSSAVLPVSNSRVPVIRQNTWSSKVVVPVGTATVIFSSDDFESSNRTQLVLTATPID